MMPDRKTQRSTFAGGCGGIAEDNGPPQVSNTTLGMWKVRLTKTCSGIKAGKEGPTRVGDRCDSRGGYGFASEITNDIFAYMTDKKHRNTGRAGRPSFRRSNVRKPGMRQRTLSKDTATRWWTSGTRRSTQCLSS